MFVQLRNNPEQQLEKAMDTVTKFFKEKNDFLYKREEIKGEIKTEERKNRMFAESLKLGLLDKQAAEVAKVPVEFVAKVRADL